MNNEEKILEQKCGRKSPFRVPDDYFEDFAKKIMEDIPDTTKSMDMRMHDAKGLRKYVAIALVAASLFTAMFTLGGLINRSGKQNQPSVASTAHQSSQDASYNSFDQACNYAMIDNEDMYAYCSENGAD